MQAQLGIYGTYIGPTSDKEVSYENLDVKGSSAPTEVTLGITTCTHFLLDNESVYLLEEQ